MASTLIMAMSGAQAQETGGAGIGEIIVTAQKREERLQDVPLAIQAFSTEKLQELNVSRFDDYAKYLPNVSYQELGPGFARVFMRGVSSGDNGNHSGPLPSVGMYLDEQPITTIQGPLDIHVYDIARVEALAGPQGTLYGASSQAGTIRIITNKPEVGTLSGSYDLTLNNVSDGSPGGVAEGYVNLPIGGSAAIRLVGWFERDGGYVDNRPAVRTYPTLNCTTNVPGDPGTFNPAAPPGSPLPGCQTGPVPGGIGTFDNARFTKDDFNEANTAGARAALRIELNDNWTVTPTFMLQSQDTHGTFFYDPAVGDLKVHHFAADESNDDWYQAALTVEGKIGDWTVTYAGAYLNRDDDTKSDYSDYALAYDNYYFNSATCYGCYFFNDDGAVISPAEHIHGQDWYGKLSQELRITSPAENRFRFVAGLFYQDQKHDIEQRYFVDGLATSAEVTGWPDTWWLTEQKREDEDKAIFGEVTYDFTEKLSGTAGIRFFDSDNSLKGFFGFGYTNGWTSRTGEKSCFGFEYGHDNFPPDPIVPPPSPGGGTNGAPCDNLNKKISDSDETHKLNLTYKFDADHMVYATYATGYRPGGVNRRTGEGFGPYDPDFLDSYEIGWKTTWFDGTFRWNGAVFYQTWDNFQFSFLGQNGLTNVSNAPGGATIPGVESEVEWAATDDLTLSAALMYVDPKLDGDFCENLVDVDGLVGPDPDQKDDPLSLADCKTFYPDSFTPDGTTLPVTPKFKGNLQARYAYALGGMDGHLQGSLVYQGSSRSALSPSDEALLGGKQDAYTIVDVSATVEKNSWNAELFVANVFDERADLYRFAQCDEGYCAALAGFGGSTYVVPNQPRTIGLRFGQKFGGGK